MLNSHVFEFNGVHQVMKGHVCIAAAKSSQKRSHQSRKSNQRIAAKGAEEKVEPHYIRLAIAQRLQQAIRTRWIVERPAPDYREAFQFGMLAGKFIG